MTKERDCDPAALASSVRGLLTIVKQRAFT
jgi:hypothetical protein